MMRNKIALAIVLSGAAVLASPARALGPVDIDAGLQYWDSDIKVDTMSEGSSAAGAFVDLGLGDHWVIGAAYDKVDPDSGSGGDFTSVNVKYKFLAPSRNNFFAVGAGMERLSIEDADSTSARVFAEGRVSVKIVWFYARVAYIPSLDDLSNSSGTLKGDSGKDFDAGVAVKPMPFFYIFGGYKDKTRTFDEPGFGKFDVKVKGPYAGVGFNF